MKLLCIHGAGGGSWQWASWVPVLQAQGLTCQCLELCPRADLAATTLADYQTQVDAQTQAATEPLVLVGASLGGLLALRAAVLPPVVGLILVNAVPPALIPGWPPQPRRFARIIRWQDSAPQATHQALPDANWEAAEAAHRQWRNESGAVMQALWAGVPLACKPRVPSLVLAGSLDTTVPPSVQAALAAQLDGDYYQAAGVSHLGALLGQRAAMLAQWVGGWLGSQHNV